MYLQSLLRDRLCTIRTDHRNLLSITEASNPMIVRWFMASSEFSFTLEFIPGVALYHTKCTCTLRIYTYWAGRGFQKV